MCVAGNVIYSHHRVRLQSVGPVSETEPGASPVHTEHMEGPPEQRPPQALHNNNRRLYRLDDHYFLLFILTLKMNSPESFQLWPVSRRDWEKQPDDLGHDTERGGACEGAGLRVAHQQKKNIRTTGLKLVSFWFRPVFFFLDLTIHFLLHQLMAQHVSCQPFWFLLVPIHLKHALP